MDSSKIFIDTDNEITFILERILGAKTERVCLVVPDRASIFTSISSLKLIKRVVDKSNKLLILVTLDQHGAELARRVGFSVVSRIGDINEDLWEKLQKDKFEIIKKNSNKVFYTPDFPVQQESAKKMPDSSTIARLSDLKSEDLVYADTKFAETNIEKNEVLQIPIYVKEEEIVQLQREELKEKVVEESQSVDKLLENEYSRSSNEKSEQTSNTSSISRFRLRKSTNKTSPLRIHFVEGYDLRKK